MSIIRFVAHVPSLEQLIAWNDASFNSLHQPGFPREITMMPTVAELLARKQRLLERLQEDPRLNEQDEIERSLARINALLNRIDRPQIEARAMRH